VADPNQPKPMTVLGHVTSSYSSPALGHPIALAMVEAGRSRHGETLQVLVPGGASIPVKLVPPVFYDAEGSRLDVV
jgi:sarcosine oxidase subunit alpha